MFKQIFICLFNVCFSKCLFFSLVLFYCLFFDIYFCLFLLCSFIPPFILFLCFWKMADFFLVLSTNRINKTFFSPYILSSCFLIHTSLHSAQPQGSSSLYNALRKEGIIMNRRNCVVRREKVVCVSYLGSLKCRTTNSQVYRIYSL